MDIIATYETVRQTTENLCQPLVIEDYVIQSIEDVSPPKWHLAHTTWFFETFLLQPHLRKYKLFNPLFQYLFNSYYQHFGSPYPRIQRGLLSRPTVETVYAYRKYVNEHVLALLNETISPEIKSIVTLGLHHEQQHQELLLMDIKHNFSLHPHFPSYQAANEVHSYGLQEKNFIPVQGGLVEIGYDGNDFCFDNELPRHTFFLQDYEIASRLITNGEYAEFIEAGGYKEANWWLADGWECVLKNQWQAPLYWFAIDHKWYEFTLSGLQELDPNKPVVHVNFYEAESYARFHGARLPTAAEWEYFVTSNHIKSDQGNFLESYFYHPEVQRKNNSQFFGDVWEWTATPYNAYPGFKPLAGAIGEYNGKFMSNQMELRGGSCVTPQKHIRASYRNFFQPDKRWQFSGIRLAK